MRLFNFCGIHRPKKLINTLPGSSRYGPERTYVQTYKSGIIITSGKTVELATNAAMAFM